MLLELKINKNVILIHKIWFFVIIKGIARYCSEIVFPFKIVNFKKFPPSADMAVVRKFGSSCLSGL